VPEFYLRFMRSMLLSSHLPATDTRKIENFLININNIYVCIVKNKTIKLIIIIILMLIFLCGNWTTCFCHQRVNCVNGCVARAMFALKVLHCAT